ncbi:MAG: hypothetical protein ABEJ95_01170 [Candidatus Nanohalobium sp.]
MGEDIIHENASEYIETGDVREVLNDYDHNFGNTEYGAYNVDALEGKLDVEGEEHPVHYQMKKMGAEFLARDMLRDGVVEVIRWDGGYSGNRKQPSGSIVGRPSASDKGSAKLRDFDARDFGDFYQEVLEKDASEHGFARDSDATAATAVALSAIDRALEDELEDEVNNYTRNEDASVFQMHQQPSSERYIGEVANDAEAQAFQPKSFGQRVVEKLS